MIKPVILRAPARSGSTYMMQLISRFKEVVATQVHPYEIRVAQYFAACYRTLSAPADHETSSRPNLFHRDKGEKWIGTNPFNNTGSLRHQKWMKARFNPSLLRFYQKTVENYYRSEARGQQKRPRYFIEKSFYVGRKCEVQDANVLKVLFPDCIDLYCVRHPLDILVSQQKFFVKEEQPDVAFMQQKAVALSAHLTRMVADYDRYPSHVIHYEKLIVDPHDTLSKMADFLGLKCNGRLIDKLLHATQAEISQQHITSSSPAQSVNRWETELDPEVVAFSRVHMKSFMETFGYDF